ncbi:MAG: sugar ABC transporter permease [bacterium]
MKRKIYKNLWIILFSTPLFLYLFGFTLLPILSALRLSFMEKGTETYTLGNYFWLFQHFQFNEAVINTITITILALILELALGLGIALLFYYLQEKRFVRALFLIPLGIPTIVAAANMRYFFDTSGFLNEILLRLHLIRSPIEWLAGGFLTLAAIVVSDMWKVTPLIMLILLAGIERIPKDLFEAAQIDGASEFNKFRFIILPLLKPFITMAIIIRGIDTFRIFELPLTLVGGTFKVLSSFAYFEYREFNNPNTAAAASTILFLIIAGFMYLYLKNWGKEDTARC